MVHPPIEVLEYLCNNEQGELTLNSKATKKHWEIFNKWKKDVDSGQESDVEIVFQS